MAINSAGVGFTAIDLIPPHIKLSIKEMPPGVLVDVDDYDKCGLVIGIVLDEADWESYDTEFEQKTLLGVAYVGAITGYVGICTDTGWYGTTKAPLAHQALVDLIKEAINNFGYEKEIRDTQKPLTRSEDEMFNIAVVMTRTRPFSPVDLAEIKSKVQISPTLTMWGKQFCEDSIAALPNLYGITARKPVGMICIGAGWRFWAVGGASKYSSKKNRVAEDRPNIKKGFEKVIKSEEVRKYRSWKKVWWKGDWIGE